MTSDEERPPESRGPPWRPPSPSVEAWASHHEAPGQSDEGSDESEDDFGNTYGFNVVLPADGVGEPLQEGLTLKLQPRIASRLAHMSLRMAMATSFLSLISFGFTAFFFLLVLRVPSERTELPDGFDSWTSCHANATRPAVTAIGHELPLHQARVLVSVPKFFEAALLVTLSGCLTSRWHPKLSGINGLLVFQLAVVAAPVYLLGNQMSIWSLPPVLDPAVMLAMGLTFTVIQCISVIGPRRCATGVVARHPKPAFFIAMLITFGTAIVMVHVLGIAGRYNMHPGLAVCASAVLIRGCSFVARCIFRSIRLSTSTCFCFFFAYELSMVLALRRYCLALPDLRDVAIASLVSAVLELGCHALSTVYAVHEYYSLMSRGCGELARTQIKIFFTAVTCDLIAEHVAIHGGLGYSLFLDPRILDIDVQLNKKKAIDAWALSFAVELAVDIAFYLPLISFLPFCPGKLLHKHSRSPTRIAFLVNCCVHCHLAGLHASLYSANYICE